MAFKKTILFILLLAGIVSALFFFEGRGEYSYPGQPALATEYPPPDEGVATRSIINALKAVAKDSHPRPERVLRGAHTKQHGLVKAEFTVLDDLDPAYRVGLFARPDTYPAWIRYSNLSGQDPEIKQGARGMAIKLMGVEGEKILPRERDAKTQDFVFMSTPFFVTKDVKGFADLLDALRGGKRKSLVFLITHPRLALLMRKTNAATADLFAVDWFSATPYKFGDRAVKYVVKSRTRPDRALPEGDPSPHFLRQRLAQRLTRGDVALDFYIQVQRNPKSMPIEDPRMVWSEDRAPLVRVATILVLEQEFDTPTQQLYGDQLTFTPWHSLPEHRPLGGVNRGRGAIYEALSDFRHARNDEIRTEPESWADFDGG